jgi:hypothetical protein
MPSKNKKSLSNISDSFFDINNDTTTKSSYYITLVAIIISLCINFFILYWLIKVDKCKCANIEESLYLKEWYLFLVCYQLIMFMMILFNISIPKNNTTLMLLFIFSTILSITSFVMIIRLLIYISKLKKNNCDCGMNKQQNIIYYYYIVVFSIILFFIILSLLTYLFK